MSYLVFARKWRPLTFDDVVGQEHVTATLKKAIEKNRVAHAYIFSGTRGVGKTTTARILARALNCDKGPTPNPCGQCEPCKNIISGSSFDVLEIDGASNNSVDDIRELRENVHYSSMGGKYRIYVIDEVHMLSKSAFNALLKTLEEPPKNVIFIFATTEPQKIPATIHSRCQRHDFRRISIEQIAGRLAYICTEEKIAFDKAALTLIARKAEGSMRDGLSLLDQVYSYSQDSIDEAAVRSVLGIIDTEVYATIVKAVGEKNPSPALSAVEDVLARGFDLHEFVVGFEEHLRTLLFCRIPGVLDNTRIAMPADGRGDLVKQAASFSEETLLRMAELVRRTEHDLKWSEFPRFIVELMLLKLVHMDDTVSIETLVKAISRHSPAVAPSVEDAAPAAKKKTDPAFPPVTQETGDAIEDADDVPDVVAGADDDAGQQACTPEQTDAKKGSAPDWPGFIDYIQRERPPLGYHLSVASVVSASGHSIDLRFPHAFHFQFAEVNKKKNRDEIQKKLADFFGTPVELRITIEAGEESAQKPRAAETRSRLSIDNEIGREPVIKNVLDVFDGTVL
jgi:DNA polymerase-3 subunit gamma/tau